MICEKCNIEITTTYGSGRFCSISCARSFSTMAKRLDINKRVSEKTKGRKRDSNRVHTEEIREKTRQTWLNKIMKGDFDSLSYESKRKRIIIEQAGACNHCGITEWHGKKLTLEIDHINGIGDHNARDNLEAICPNCHSVTDTWRGRNKPSRNGDNRVSDEELSQALRDTSNIRQALLITGLAAKGGNYKRAKKLLLVI